MGFAERVPNEPEHHTGLSMASDMRLKLTVRALYTDAYPLRRAARAARS
jgi:hypothetical protein